MKQTALFFFLLALATACSEDKTQFTGSAGKEVVPETASSDISAPEPSIQKDQPPEGPQKPEPSPVPQPDPLPSPIDDPGEDALPCEGVEVKFIDVPLSFPATNGTGCKWGQDGNLEAGSSNLINAIASFEKSFATPADMRELCSFDLSIKGDNLIYDDDITFTIDGFAFAGDYLSRDFLKSQAGLREENGLLLYERSKIIGQKWPQERSWIESGITGAFKVMQREDTQREGSIDLSMTREFLTRLPKATIKSMDHRVGFHISGNKNVSDCQHSGMTINVKIKYLP